MVLFQTEVKDSSLVHKVHTGWPRLETLEVGAVASDVKRSRHETDRSAASRSELTLMIYTSPPPSIFMASSGRNLRVQSGIVLRIIK